MVRQAAAGWRAGSWQALAISVKWALGNYDWDQPALPALSPHSDSRGGAESPRIRFRGLTRSPFSAQREREGEGARLEISLGRVLGCVDRSWGPGGGGGRPAVCGGGVEAELIGHFSAATWGLGG